MTYKPHSSYLKRFFISFLLLVLAFGGLNFIIDPYALFGTPRIEGLSQMKPAAATRLRLSKPYQVRRYRPRTLIGGNSRPEMGIDPGHKCWPPAVRPVYNLGLPGVGVYRQARSLQHAGYNSDVVLILWGLDFADFLSAPTAVPRTPQWPPKAQAYETRLVVTAEGKENPDYSASYLKSYLKTLISLDTTRDSLVTILQQGNHYSSNRLANGFNPAQDYIPIIQTEGQQVLFRQKIKGIGERFSRQGLSIFSGQGESSTQFKSLEHFLNTIDHQKSEVYLFINPYHTDYLSAIYTNGLWEQFEQWKWRLVEIANRYKVPLWDFSVITPYNSEPSPSADVGAGVLKWFWEPAHYKREVGNMMLVTMLPDWCQKTLAEPVGIKLELKSINTILERERIKIGVISNN